MPTSEPTYGPSRVPSSEPTYDPSRVPSSEPTYDPSRVPSSRPISVDSIVRTSVPTFLLFHRCARRRTDRSTAIRIKIQFNSTQNKFEITTQAVILDLDRGA